MTGIDDAHKAPLFRTEAILAENPEDDFRLHHVYWFFQPSYDAEKAARGIGDISRVEVSSCMIYCGEARDLTLAEGLEKLAALEAGLVKSGGKPLAADDDFYRERMGGDYKKARHFSAYEDLRRQEIEKIAQETTRLGNGIQPMRKIRLKPRN